LIFEGALPVSLMLWWRWAFNVTVLDLSEAAIAVAKARLGSRANQVKWVVADVTTWEPQQVYDLWHDRAASTSSPRNTTARHPSPT
jgi:trans-aconitate methyltransferase